MSDNTSMLISIDRLLDAGMVASRKTRILERKKVRNGNCYLRKKKNQNSEKIFTSLRLAWNMTRGTGDCMRRFATGLSGVRATGKLHRFCTGMGILGAEVRIMGKLTCRSTTTTTTCSSDVQKPSVCFGPKIYSRVAVRYALKPTY